MSINYLRSRRPSSATIFVVLLLTICAVQPLVAQRKTESGASAIKIPFESYKLPNGLNVILSVDRATPTVAVDVWYHVGSKNELPGRTGFAHLFEHVMFTGSGHVPYGLHDKLTEGVGGNNNGSTTNDRTNYYEVVPSNYLESALWMESDRMGFLLDTLDTAKLNAQRDVVKNERRQSYDNQPYGRVSEIFAAAMYPKTHPYSWPVIGSMTDLSAASEEDVKAFFRLYYAPNNATLAVVGDFDPVQAKAWIAKYFNDLPQGKTVERPSVPLGKLELNKRLVYEDRVQVPRLYIQWPTVGAKHDDDAALSVLGAILSGPRTARLTKALVYDSQVASQVGAFQRSNEDVGEFQVIVIPRAGHTLTEIEAAIDKVLQQFVSEGPTAEEVQKATAGLELGFLRGLESNLGKANQLLDGAVFHGDPGYFRTDYQKTLAVTPADVKRVAAQYLAKSRIVLSVVPKGKKDQAANAAESETVTMLLNRGGK
ncbi:MAG TPA: pitrilysin family protein [Pyrinomonadaceae bacterium]|nr:pitrilysin family protein [Pyrinomonadaceae bacterium]